MTSRLAAAATAAAATAAEFLTAKPQHVTATGPVSNLVERLLADDPQVWRPAHAELVARIWQPPARLAAPKRPWEPHSSAAPSLAAPKPRTGGPAARTGGADGRCGGCRGPLTPPARGPRPEFCSDRCRKRVARARAAASVPDAWRWPA